MKNVNLKTKQNLIKSAAQMREGEALDDTVSMGSRPRVGRQGQGLVLCDCCVGEVKAREAAHMARKMRK